MKSIADLFLKCVLIRWIFYKFFFLVILKNLTAQRGKWVEHGIYGIKTLIKLDARGECSAILSKVDSFMTSCLLSSTPEPF